MTNPTMNPTVQVPHKFRCRSYQISAWEALKSGKKKAILCWHRGAGKDLFALNYFIWHMVKNWDKPAVYLHCFPNYSQGKKAIWNSLHNTDDGDSVPYLSHFPEQLIKYRNGQEMRIELVNGSMYMVMGIDGKNAQLARGMNPTNVIISEYAYMAEESWDVIEPRVSQNKGQVIFASTPNGKNHFYKEYNYAASAHKPDYYASIVTNNDTHIHSEEHFKDLREKGKPEDFIQQEYFCDFTKGAQGSYYGKFIQDARNDNRICSISINATLPCHTAWDIGIGDSTAIWIFQALANGNINLFDYYENTGEGIEHYIRYIDKWKHKNNAIMGTHYVPHDMQQREFTSGVDRLTTAREMGLQMLVVPRKGLEEGIQAVRSILPHCTFNEATCKRGIDCLDFYRKKYNESLKTYYDEPLHDQYSHGADAFRYMAIGIKALGPSGPGKLSAEQIKEMRIRNYGY